MQVDRRAFLAGAAGAVTIATLGPGTSIARGATRPLFVSCGMDGGGHYLVAAMDPGGAVHFEQPLPARGHGVAFHPSRPHCAAFARRPGTFAVVLDSENGEVVKWIEAAAGRHYHGHGVFTADGRLLFASESDFETGCGLLGAYDATDGYRRIGETPTQGIGPHELRLMPDQRSLVVANGGIRTHPDRGRAKLNIPTMKPNLTYLDSESGTPLETARLAPELHKLSIRHLDVNQAGEVAIALQYEGDRRDKVPLVALHRAGSAPRLLHAPAPVERRMRHYTGSIAFDASGSFLAVSSPRGHIITLWDADAEAFLGHVKAVDAAGVVPTGRTAEFLVTGGDGVVQLVNACAGTTVTVHATDGHLHWDNHIARAAVF